ncbi:DUF4461 domain-containing protein [Chloropicon primus]|nr:DUF4461 domain-containing protein [Chloropicon primus]
MMLVRRVWEAGVTFGVRASRSWSSRNRHGVEKLTPEGTEKEIKSKLNQLYKLVHPDLFHSHPEAKEENERSFKLLQQFMSESDGGVHQRGAKTSSSFQFKFYLRKSEGQGAATSPSPEATFQKVDVELRQPSSTALGWRGKESGAVNPLLTRALNKLLKACGLETISVPTEGEAEAAVRGGEEAYESFAGTNLIDFLPYAADRFHRSGGHAPKSQQTDMIRSTLRMFRGVTTSFSRSLRSRGDDSELSRQGQTCLESLMRALDADHTINVRGLKLILDQTAKVSATGAMHVNVRELNSKEAWAAYLSSSQDLEVARLRTNFVEGIRRSEDRVASELGITSIHCSAEALAHPEACQELLQQILRRTENVRNYSGHRTNKIVVDKTRECAINQIDGTIVVPLTLSADRILDFFSASAGEADRISFEHQKEVKELERLTYLVRSRLKVRIFSREEGVTIHQFRQCCNRLVRMSKSLMPYTEGLNLRVSGENRLNLSENCVDIAWNFA